MIGGKKAYAGEMNQRDLELQRECRGLADGGRVC